MLWLFVYSFKQINYNQFKLCETFRQIIVSGILLCSYIECIALGSAQLQVFKLFHRKLLYLDVYPDNALSTLVPSLPLQFNIYLLSFFL